jgi:hypothetical protein
VTAPEVIDVEWLTDDELQISLQRDHEDVGAVHVRVLVDDTCHPFWGRDVDVQVVDVEGDPACAAWAAAHEGEIVDRYDARQARLRGVWA